MADQTKKIIPTKESGTLSFGFTPEYKQFISQLKTKIRGSRLRAALAVNTEVIALYWHIGKEILEKKQWGSKLIDRLSQDLRTAFPESRGFSIRNLQRVRKLAASYPDYEFMPQSVAQLPWGHISVLIQMVSEDEQRTWYATQAQIEGWSRQHLTEQIKTDLYQRQALPGDKASNFATRLPEPQSRLALELLKQPYSFDFLGLHDEANEREVEYAATDHIKKFLLELGKGFAFVGQQVPIKFNGTEYFIDLLFYHLKLHAFVVIELKAKKFKPEHAGQLNFYLNLVDDFYKTEQDNKSIGLILCKSRDKLEAEYALKGIEKPIGVSEYELTRAIPDDLKCNLPTIEEIEAELSLLV